MSIVKTLEPPTVQPPLRLPVGVSAPRKTSKAEIYYPESDGKPMGETDWHMTVIMYLREALRYVFRADERIYVAADMLFYYVEGKPRIFKVPDVFVVKGVPRHSRRIYKLWEEKAAPCVIFEISSRDTREEDIGSKRTLYEQLGVKEYILFDPLGEYLDPRLQGFRLSGRFYTPMPLAADGALLSHELGLILRPEDEMLRLVEPATGQNIPTIGEALFQAQVDARRAQTEAQRAQAEAQRAQAEAQRAQAEEQRAQAEEQRAQAEERKAQAEERKAQAEAQRADRAEAELARLRAELALLRGQTQNE